MIEKRQTGWFNLKFFITAAAFLLTAAVFLTAVSSGNMNLRADNCLSLEVSDAVSGKVYLRQKILQPSAEAVAEAGEFAIEYIHSVNNSPVLEIFRIENERIKPVMLKFYSFGAGMPSELEEGQQMGRDGDAIVITGFNREFTELNYIVGTVSDHLLIINEERISLRELCGRNAHISLRITQ